MRLIGQTQLSTPYLRRNSNGARRYGGRPTKFMTMHLRNTQLPAGTGTSTVLADMDFETYSEAGYVFHEDVKKWKCVVKASKGINAVGAPVYSEHPTTEVLSLAYDLKDGTGPHLWVPGLPAPTKLFDFIASGGLIEAWNSAFEYYIWRNVCHARMGWPELPLHQLRDAMAKSYAFSLPGQLGKAAQVLKVTDQKMSEGQRLLDKFSKPRSPTKHDDRQRLRPTDPDHQGDGQLLYDYNIGDIKAEAAVSARVPDLSPVETELWLLDQRINTRGVYIDRPALANCITIVNQAFSQYAAELQQITGGTVMAASEVAKIMGFVGAQGVVLPDLTADTIEATLKDWDYPDTPGHNTARRVLEIRALLGAASVKKLFSIDRRLSRDGRLRDLFAYHGADRTGRFAGRGPQPQNLPSSGPKVVLCDPASDRGGCGKHYRPDLETCPWCGTEGWLIAKPVEWSVDAVEDALSVIATQDLHTVEHYFGDAVATVSGCLRGLFSAPPGGDLICSDYSAIEAVVLAALAGEEWRLEVFRTHGKIYEMSAAEITGTPFEEFKRHKDETGEHHPLRKGVGKISELASGFGGWVGAWKAFGAEEHIGGDKEIKDAILAWRDASPMICEFWGGQVRKHPDRWEWWPDLHGLEGAAVQAILNPGQCFAYRGISYGVKDDILYCQLLNGRKLTYHQPLLTPITCRRSKLPVFQISYMGWNTDYKKGPKGWLRMETYGGKLTENVTQATARDILTHAMVNLDKAGYPLVLHVHDEVVVEVAEGTGSVEQVEEIMGQNPEWAKDWPIKAAGGWRGKRYRKD